MRILDNVSHLLGNDLKETIRAGTQLKIAASCFSIYAFEALKEELEKIDALEFIFTAPAFLPDQVTDKLKREHREFLIPKVERERSFYGSEFEIQLKNKLTQRAIAKVQLVEGIEGEPFAGMEAVKDVPCERAERIEIQIGDEGDLATFVPVPDAYATEPAIDIERPNIEMRDAVAQKAGQVLERPCVDDFGWAIAAVKADAGAAFGGISDPDNVIERRLIAIEQLAHGVRRASCGKIRMSSREISNCVSANGGLSDSGAPGFQCGEAASMNSRFSRTRPARTLSSDPFGKLISASFRAGRHSAAFRTYNQAAIPVFRPLHFGFAA